VGILRKSDARKRLFGALLLAVSSVCSLFITPFAMATSTFDDDYQKIDSASVATSNYYGVTCAAQDLTYNWHEYILDNTKWHDPNQTTGGNVDAKASLERALENGRWTVSAHTQWGDGGYFRTLTVAWTEDNGMYLDWTQDGFIYVRSNSGTGSAHGVHTVLLVNQQTQLGGELPGDSVWP
jgi:hypothetical protein